MHDYREFLMTGHNAEAAEAAAWACAMEWAARAAREAGALRNKQERRLVAYAQAARAGAFFQ